MACDHAFLGGSSTWARTRDLRINSTISHEDLSILLIFHMGFKKFYQIVSNLVSNFFERPLVSSHVWAKLSPSLNPFKQSLTTPKS